MCGIGGILRTDGQPIPEEWLDAIDARIAYRGPDGHGRFRDRVEIADPNAPGGKRVVEVAFVHRRLSIIDHKDGAQPMVSQRGRNDSEGLVAVVFNGCIYNHRELRRELENRGHKFVTDHSDTEVLIHGWREWRIQVVDHLEGMYAFAIWDRIQTSMTWARDWFGEKPLYWSTQPYSSSAPQVNGFASVSSAIDFLNSDELDAQNSWLKDYLHSGKMESTAPAGIAGAVVNVQSALAFSNDTEPNDDHESRTRGSWLPQLSLDRDETERLLRQAVHRRLEADVPVGCFLSGGVDSSLVSFFAKQSMSDIRTFSVRMPDPRFDESSFAESVARHLGMNHVTLVITASPADDLQFLIRRLGQPFGDSSILPTYWVSKAAREYVKVALTGDGGDELFVGYERYVAARFLVRWRNWLRLLPVSFLLRAHPKTKLNKLARLCEMALDYPFHGVGSMEAIFTARSVADLTEHPLPERLSWNSEADAMIAIRSLDIDNYLPNDLLRKVDTASMACGLEVRCPFLDRDLARAALSAPIEQLMPGGQRKGLLRQIARKYLPREIVDRPKMGFAIPIGEWFRDDDLPHKGSGMKTLLLDHLNSAEPFGPIQLNRKTVQRFIDEHMSGKRDHGQRLFTLLTLSIWARQVNAATHQSTRT